MESIFRKGRVECLVNPTLGREKEMEIHPTNTPRKVMVIGGGPGGLNVAWVAAKKGHEVSLYEKQALLGGQLILGSVSNFKKELRSLIDFQKRQVEKYGVKCHLNIEATLDTVKDENPDVVILATGSVPIKPSVEGIDTPIVSVFPQIFDGNRPIIKKTLLIGGGATGCEAALYLSENGSPVTIVEKLPKIGMNIESVTKRVMLNKLEQNNVRIMTEYELSRVAENGVFIRDREGKEVFLEGERVVIAIGTRPDNGLYDEISSLGITIYQIGDCLEPRGAKAAISEGAEIGRAI
jgi:NADPH-dependent 2,4-dienoyl-CoA reductase/sulfur reductase-like enzyme